LIVEETTANDSQRILFTQFGASLAQSVRTDPLGSVDQFRRTADPLGGRHAAHEIHLCQIDLSHSTGDLTPQLVGND
jgi:hypothetical protein